MPPGPRIELDAGGAYLPELDLHVDPEAPVGRAFLTHAHARADGHGEVLASPETLALLGVEPARARPIAWETPTRLVHEGVEATLAIAPRTHLPGAARLRVELPSGNVLFAGHGREDAAIGANSDNAAIAAHRADAADRAVDAIVVDATFGLPIFRFPPRDEVLRAIVAFCRERREGGASPVVAAAPLGDAHAIARALLDAGIPVCADEVVRGAARRLDAMAPAHAVSDRVEALASKARVVDGVALVAPGRDAARLARGLRRGVLAYASARALLDAAIEQQRADAAFVLAGQAGFDELVAEIEASGARRVIAVRGDAAAFASALRARGVDASGFDGAPLDREDA